MLNYSGILIFKNIYRSSFNVVKKTIYIVSFLFIQLSINCFIWGQNLESLADFNYNAENIISSDSLISENIATRNDNFYAWRCLKALGIDTSDGLIRLSMVHYNNSTDVKKLLKALNKI